MTALRIVVVGLAAGLAFAVLDVVVNVNPLARRLYAVYGPITRTSVNAPLGTVFDLVAGVVMAALFVLLSPALPGGAIAKGLAFGAIAWFFRVAMGVASQATMYTVPGATLAYTLAAGLVEMLILGCLYALALRAA